MKADASVGWVLPVLVAVSGAMVIGLAAYGQQGDARARESMRAAAKRLGTILRRERVYFTNNHAYTSSLEELGLPAIPGDPWRYHLISSHVDARPFLLIEADDGAQRVCIDLQGNLYHSELQALPAVPVWLPAEGGRGLADAK